jgi:hypothetical protein
MQRMSRERLELALAQIPPSAWEDFEEFASEFLISDFPNLRTMARQAGDQGRDADIYSLDGAGRIKLQYSVAVGWRSKIIETVGRLKKFNPRPTHLTYVTNQRIGPEADDLKRTIFADDGIVLDVRDCSYFLDRRDHTIAAQAASEVLEQKFLEPLLTRAGVTQSVAPALTAEEERLAFLHISIDLLERDSERNLSKAAHESLVLAVLHGSTHETPLERAEIHARICSFVHSVTSEQLVTRIDAALQRLSTRHGKIKYVRGSDSFHIAHGESTRIKQGMEVFLDQESSFEQDILAAIYMVDSAIVDDDGRRDDCVRAIREIIEKLLLDYGEQFSIAISTGRLPETDRGKLEHLLTEMAFKTHLSNVHAVEVIQTVLAYGTEATSEHLRRLLDSYTVLAMLKSTPDVQRVLRKVFTGGQIWLDTSAILPLMAEGLYKKSTPMRDLVRACRLSDMKLYVTTGVIEEINANLNGCVAAARGTSPSSYRIPFLLREYLLNGHSRDGFVAWQEDFRGTESPLLDIEEYLKEEFGVTRRDLQDEVDAADKDLRIAAQDFWREVQQKRRGSNIYSVDLDRLTAHDVENTVGVIKLRGQSNPGPAGYQHWWLTLDGSAKGLSAALELALNEPVPSPVIDPGYLVQLMRFRPHTSEETTAALNRFPVLLDLAKMDVIPGEMIEVIEGIRKEIPTITPRLLRRKVRDEVNRRKLGESDVEEDVEGADVGIIDVD